MRSPILATLLLGGTLLGSLAAKPLAAPRSGPARTGAGENTDATLSPYFWVKGGDAAADPLPLKSTSVKASIAGVIADVSVTQVYANTGKKPLEAIYVFPGSTRAAVYGMKMTIGERTIQAKIRSKEQARQEYEEARQQGKSASLLEQRRPNVFQMNVANIMPGDEIRVELSYTELLVPTEGTYEFVYPTVVGPRYSNTPATQATDSEKWVANPYTKQGEAPLSTFDLEVRLAAGMPIARMACDTHKTGIAYDGATNAVLKLDASEKRGGNRDFILKYQLAGGRIQSGLLLSKGKDENFFLLMVQPPKHVKVDAIPPREYVFIMDVSGSMHGYPLETSKTLMRDLVSHLRPQDRFNFMAFEGAATVWSPGGSQPATAENLQQALAFVSHQSGGGGTEILSALKKALALPRAEGMSRTFVIATDGYISVEPKVLDMVRTHLGDANMFAFGIGTAVNRFLIEGIAHAGMGEPFVVTRPEEAAAAAERFRQYIASPVLTQVKVAFKGFEAYDVEPSSLPDVLSERPVICFGKWKGEPTGTVELSGSAGTGPYRQSFQVAGSRPTATNALRFLWARHRIQLLGDFGGLGDPEGQRKAITELGLKYGLLTNYTSFVAIDSKVRNRGGCQRVTQPLPLPEGVSNLAVGGGNMPQAAPCLAPGVAQGYLAKRSASAAVEVVAQESRREKGENKASANLSQESLATLPARNLSDTTQLQGCLAPAAPMSTLRQDIAARLKEPALAALLANFPKGGTLELRIDAKGKVVGATFSHAFTGATEARKLIRKWRFDAWKGTGLTTLRVPVAPQS
jgi:Ca-activated chloride channel family protein